MIYKEFLAYLHPVMQSLVFLLALLVMYQGSKRIGMQLGKKAIFPWKQHVKLGSYALILWIIGASLGSAVTDLLFGSTNVTAWHSATASYVLGLAVFGLATGFVMNKYKKKRKYLPILHGVSNFILLILFVYVAYTGMSILPALGYM